ncbi:MAG: hypothetical protein U5K81_10790 [Trueperaceae bacterium]|nr:hypothetical protein [Trueperaceae bacterium]
MLHRVYLAFFAVHTLVAALLAAVAGALARVPAGPASWLGGALVLAALVQLGASLALAGRLVRGPTAVPNDPDRGGPDGAEARRVHAARRAAVGGSVAAAALFAGPVWFASLAWAAGQRGAPFLLLLGVGALGFTLGALHVGRLARRLAAVAPGPA